MNAPDDSIVAHHICILCTAHGCDDGRVTHKLGAAFSARGYRVTWVGPGASNAKPYEAHGIRFVFYKQSRGRFERLFQARRLRKACEAVADVGTVDVFFAVEPDSAAVAFMLAKRYGVRSVFDIHEIYHVEMLRMWVPRIFQGLAGWLVKRRLAALCAMVDLSIGAGSTRIQPYQQVARKSMVVRHCLARKEFENFRADIFNRDRKVMRIMHGKTTPIHGTEAVVRGCMIAQRILGNQVIIKMLCIEAKVGYGVEGGAWFRNMIERERAESIVEIHQPVPFQEMFPLMCSCDVGIIAYGREFGVNCSPNRIFEYLAVGMPVIVPVYAVEMQEVMNKYPLGMSVDVEDPGEIARAIVTMYEERNTIKERMAEYRERLANELSMESEIAPLLEWIENK